MAYYSFLVTIIGLTALSLVVLAYKTYKSPHQDRRNAILLRAKNDFRLLAANALLLFAASVAIGYVQSIFGRNLAFYRHRQLADYVVDPEVNLKQARLKDIGFELLPDHSDMEAIIAFNELLQYFAATFLLVVALYPYWTQLLHGVYRPVYTCNVITRLLCTVAVGQILRMPVYLATSIPGPSPHCIGSLEHRNRPADLAHVLWFPHVGENCGDLIFSGHILFATTAIWTVGHYWGVMKGKSFGVKVAACMLPIYVGQICCILMARAHYSVDLVTGCMVGSFNFITLAYVVWQKDRAPFYHDWYGHTPRTYEDTAQPSDGDAPPEGAVAVAMVSPSTANPPLFHVAPLNAMPPAHGMPAWPTVTASRAEQANAPGVSPLPTDLPSFPPSPETSAQERLRASPEMPSPATGSSNASDDGR